jgi:hypothetical protein
VIIKNAVLPSLMIEYYACSAKLFKDGLTTGVAIESEVVLGGSTDASNYVLGRERTETTRERSRSFLALKAQNISGKTSNVGASYRGTGDSIGTAVIPGRENRDTRGVDINRSAVVREGGGPVRAIGSADSVDSRLGSRRIIASITTIVTGGNGEEEASRDSVGGSSVNCRRLGTAKRHAADRAVWAAAGFCIVGGEVDASNDPRVGAGTAGVKDLNSVELSSLGHTVSLRAYSTSTMSSVAVAVGILAITGVIGQEGGTAFKLGVSSINTSVDNVNTSASSGSAIVGVGSRSSLGALVRDAR